MEIKSSHEGRDKSLTVIGLFVYEYNLFIQSYVLRSSVDHLSMKIE